MSHRGVRVRDFVDGHVHARVHLSRAGGDDETMCGDWPTMLGACADCADISDPEYGELADAVGGRLFLGRGLASDQSLRRTVACVHSKKPDGSPLCGGKPLRFVPCMLCLRQVYVHVRAPWAGEVVVAPGEPRHTVGVCGIGISIEGHAQTASGMLLLPPDRSLTAEEAVQWAEDDDPQLWRLCHTCEWLLGKHLRSQARFEQRAMAQIDAARLADAEKKRRAGLRDAKAETRREMVGQLADRAGVKLRNRRKPIVLADPERPRFSGPGVDSAMAALAAKHAAAAAARKEQPIPVADEED